MLFQESNIDPFQCRIYVAHEPKLINLATIDK